MMEEQQEINLAINQKKKKKTQTSHVKSDSMKQEEDVAALNRVYRRTSVIMSRVRMRHVMEWNESCCVHHTYCFF